MKIIDKTPFQDADGKISIIGRIQGTLQYGFHWFSELEAQKAVIAQLERSLEKGFVLIRNFTLPNIEVVVPLILIGPGGVYVIHVTPIKGQFEARGDQWEVVNYGRSQPASINLIELVMRRARVVQKYLEFQKVSLSAPVEGILIASDPGAHIDSLRPVVRVVMSDAIKQLASSLQQARPVWQSTYIYDLADRIVDPPPPQEVKPAVPEVQAQPAERARAIFNSTDSAPAFNPSDFDFALNEDGAQHIPQGLRETNPSRQLPSRKTAANNGKFFGLTNKQLFLLAGMAVIECLVIVGFGVILYLNL
ncbi:MAG: NERD domain-containing protein [Chloroflexi bacterium]|nr:NERD domain-containing protein [Chloroflexota bacterium]